MSSARRSTGEKRDGTPVDLNAKRTREDEGPSKKEDILQSVADKMLALERDLCADLRKITFNMPVEYVYNPIEYAFDVHAVFVHKYCTDTKKILFLGMNPGPWGMSQTGVPFGEVSMVRDWLKVSGTVGKPDKEQPERKITGFECKRKEVSGRRFWGLFQELCGEPERFFRHAYMHNYCPIALMDEKGRNITPAEMKGQELKTLQLACDRSLRGTIQLLEVDIVIGIGRYAEKRAKVAIEAANLPVKVLCLPHPSPRASRNENWNEKAKSKLTEFGLLEYFTDAN